MTENARKPKIRFKGFTDAWELHKLGETGKAQSGIGFPDCEQGGKKGIPFFKVSDMNNHGNEREMFNANNYVSIDQTHRKNWTPINNISVIFAKVGAAIMLNRKRLVRFPFFLDNNTMAFKFDNTWDIDFGFTLFEKLDLTSVVQVGALPSYNASDIENIEIHLPQNTEQIKIGTLFKQLDNLITLHQRKYDKLVNIKKALLEKMFPQGLETTPKIRFKGYTDAWEQRKFEYFFEERNERSGKGEMISVTINSGIKKFNELGRFDTKPSDLSKYKRVVVGDIAYNSMRMWQGASGYSPFTGILSPAYTVIVPKNGVSSLFFSFLIKRPQMIHQFEINSQGLTKDTWNLKFPAFSQIEAIAPKEKSEQDKIAGLFIQLDNLITLHQRKYEKLKNIKAALLEKMFV